MADATRLLHLAAESICRRRLARPTGSRCLSPSPRNADVAAGCYLASGAARLSASARRAHRPRIARLCPLSPARAERSSSLRPNASAAVAAQAATCRALSLSQRSRSIFGRDQAWPHQSQPSRGETEQRTGARLLDRAAVESIGLAARAFHT